MTVGEGVKAVKLVPIGIEAGIPVMYQLMDSLYKECLCHCWYHCITAALASLSNLNVCNKQISFI
jgi:hypothetical protein